MHRSIEYFIADMVKSAKIAYEKSRMVQLGEIEAGDDTQSIILWNLMVMGEASSHIPEDIKDQYAAVDWPRARRLRNFVAHNYFGIDWEVMFRVNETYLPSVIKELERMAASYPLPEAE